MCVSRVLGLAVVACCNSASAQDYFLAKQSTGLNETGTQDRSHAKSAERVEVTEQSRRTSDDRRVPNKPCDVPEILGRGDSASFYIKSKHHSDFLSTGGSNVDLWHSSGPHAVWHLKHVAGHTANRFYITNDWAGTYLSSSGDYNHDNVELWGKRGDRNDDYSSHKELQWLVFSAEEITVGASKCTFYIMHSDSHKWLDTHGDNVHIWGDSSDVFEVGDEPENLQWEFEPATP